MSTCMNRRQGRFGWLAGVERKCGQRACPFPKHGFGAEERLLNNLKLQTVAFTPADVVHLEANAVAGAAHVLLDHEPFLYLCDAHLEGPHRVVHDAEVLEALVGNGLACGGPILPFQLPNCQRPRDGAHWYMVGQAPLHTPLPATPASPCGSTGCSHRPSGNATAQTLLATRRSAPLLPFLLPLGKYANR